MISTLFAGAFSIGVVGIAFIVVRIFTPRRSWIVDYPELPPPSGDQPTVERSN